MTETQNVKTSVVSFIFSIYGMRYTWSILGIATKSGEGKATQTTEVLVFLHVYTHSKHRFVTPFFQTAVNGYTTEGALLIPMHVYQKRTL